VNTSIRTRLVAMAFAGCAAAAIAAPAFGNDGGGITLHRDGSEAVPFVAQVGNGTGSSASHLVLHRDGSKAVPFDPTPGTTATPSHAGFSWADAAIGAAFALVVVFALLLLGLGDALLARSRRRAKRAVGAA
jgi:hypothetical protein